MKTIIVITILLLFAGCENKVNERQAYELVIQAYKLGYIYGSNDQMRRFIYEDISFDAFASGEQRTLEYIRFLGLDSGYYKFAEFRPKERLTK